MKRILSCAFILLMLAACSADSAEQSFLDIRAAFLGGDVSLCADISADYGDRKYRYEILYCGDGKSGEITLIYPDEISGISAKIDENGSVSLKCGETLLDTGLIYGMGISPLGSTPLIVNAVREGYVHSVYEELFGEEEYIVAEIDSGLPGDGLNIIYTLWFSADELQLRRAEISADGYTAITAEFKEVQ